VPSVRWNDAILDRFRDVGDPPADAAIDALARQRDRPGVQQVLDAIVRNEDLTSGALAGDLRDYFDACATVRVPDEIGVIHGQRMFVDYGPEILTILACYSLPVAYSGRKGVQVLHRTGFLAGRPNRRLFQTAQMVIDVMTPGGLGPGGRGRATALKVRLMHAAIRRMLLTATEPWPADLGVPINQEDLAGTLMTFVPVVLDGLRKLGLDVPERGAEAYLAAWQVVGRLLGITEALIPATVDEAFELLDVILGRQVAASAEGRAMNAALLRMLEAQNPPALVRLPSALMRLFLPPRIAAALDVPVRRRDVELVEVAISAGRLLGRLKGSDARRKRIRAFSLQIVQMMILAEHGSDRPQFRIPTELKHAWQ
jgi:hypothetical protein